MRFLPVLVTLTILLHTSDFCIAGTAKSYQKINAELLKQANEQKILHEDDLGPIFELMLAEEKVQKKVDVNMIATLNELLAMQDTSCSEDVYGKAIAATTYAYASLSKDSILYKYVIKWRKWRAIFCASELKREYIDIKENMNQITYDTVKKYFSESLIDEIVSIKRIGKLIDHSNKIIIDVFKNFNLMDLISNTDMQSKQILSTFRLLWFKFLKSDSNINNLNEQFVSSCDEFGRIFKVFFNNKAIQDIDFESPATEVFALDFARTKLCLSIRNPNDSDKFLRAISDQADQS